MGEGQMVLKSFTKIKKKEHPIGRLGAHIKKGMKATYTAFFLEYNRIGLPKVGESSIRP